MLRYITQIARETYLPGYLIFCFFFTQKLINTQVVWVRVIGLKEKSTTSNGSDHTFNEDNRSAIRNHGAGETNKAPDSNGYSKASGNKGSKFIQLAVSTGGIMGGCFGLLFCDCVVFHGETPFDMRF